MINPEIDLNGQTAVVTGSSRGIGAAAVQRLAKAGANVVLLARSETDISTLSDEIGAKALALKCDVSDWADVESVFEQAHERFGSIDILVNNAGVIDPVARMADADPAAWGYAIDINLKGVFHCVRAALPKMLGSGGTIINISSGAAVTALEGWSHYCSSKAAVLSLTKCVYKEYNFKGIRCVGLSPGTVATGMQKTIAESGINPVSQMEWSAHLPPEAIGEAITWLCTDAARKYDGKDFSLSTPEGRLAVGLVEKR